MIVAMSQDGMITLKLVSGPVNGDIFIDFISSSLIPMMPFNLSVIKDWEGYQRQLSYHKFYCS